MENRSEYTPEQRMWSSVLYTYVSDSKRKCFGTDSVCRRIRRHRGIMEQLPSPWTEEVCLWLGISYEGFVDIILKNLDEECPYHKVLI